MPSDTFTLYPNDAHGTGWGDSDDSTSLFMYGPELYGFESLDPLILPDDATVTGIRAYVRAAASGPNAWGDFSLNTGSTFIDDFACYFTPGPDDSFTPLTVGGGIIDYNLVVSSHGLILDPLTVLKNGGWVGAKVDGTDRGSLTVYEFWVMVDYTTPDPPVRTHGWNVGTLGQVV